MTKQTKNKDQRNLYFLIGMFSMYIISSFTLMPLINSLEEQKVIAPLFWAFLPFGLCYIIMKKMNKIVKYINTIK